MIRFLLYSSLVLAFAAATYYRAGMAATDLKTEVVSVAGEGKKHGKPVYVHRIGYGSLQSVTKIFRRSTFPSVTKISGIAAPGGLIKADATPEIARSIRQGQRFDGCGVRGVSGEVESVSGSPGLATGLHAVLLRVRKGMPGPGTIVVLCARKPTAAGVLRIPRAAHRSGADGDFSWVVTEGKVERRKIKLGDADEDFFRVVSGLSKGDVVVVNGWRSLEEGDRVRVRR
ncbi:hypothetical protein ACFL2T_04760 [Elusimicrobiota bacterium]